MKKSWSGIGCWFWTGDEFQPEGYKRPVDLYRDYSGFELLTASIRHPVEVTDPEVHDQIKRAVEYAQTQGIRVAVDLDVRLARQAFQDAHPDEMQEIVCLREASLDAPGEVLLQIEPITLRDHYTHRARDYDTVASRVLRVYSYRRGPEGIEPETVADITASCRVEQADAAGVAVAIPCSPEQAGRTACVMAALTLFTPAVFAPHLPEFERGILEQYADVPLAGACKDEWGFSGRFTRSTDDLWFSRFMATAYSERRPGHDLVRDLLLMAKSERGREADRAAAINHYMEMCWQRNSQLENAFCRATKDIFGPDAVMATHPTWFPFPGELEAFKNGLYWWACKRDLAQTDEATPFAARTALAKKWYSPLWYNMYYNDSREPYNEDLWRAILGGGRLNFHPVQLRPRPPGTMHTSLLAGDLLRADCRVRLLNYISTAPVDCPVAVIFGHPAALNWASESFGDTGLDVTNGLWQAGYYTDLIPSSEIASAALTIAEDGRIQYGPQRYAAVVLYHPQFERSAVADFFRDVSTKGQTALYRIGDWTQDFEGNAFDGNAALIPAMQSVDVKACISDVIARLDADGIEPQTPCTMRGTVNFPESMMPQPSGQCRLLDGTVIIASGEKDVMGDPIRESVSVNGYEVRFDAVGIAAVRLDGNGEVAAMAGGGLKRFDAPHMLIELPERADIALWRDSDGTWAGVLQGHEGPIPEDLTQITTNWTRVRLPMRYIP